MGRFGSASGPDRPSTGVQPGTVQTVTGAVAPSELGPTLMHEHVFDDVRWALEEPADEQAAALAAQRVGRHNLWWVRRQPCASADNLRLSGVASAVRELRAFADAGGSAVVELTVRGIGPRPDLLVRVAHAVPIHIVAGTGYYMHRTRSPDWAWLTVEQVAATLVDDIVTGFAGSGTRAGIIGELAVEGPQSTGIARIDDLGDDDRKLLRAGTLAQAVTGAAISIHLPHSLPGGASPAELAHGVVDLMEEAGADLTRVILGHVDRSRGWTGEALANLAARGVVLEFDEWGLEGYVDSSGHVNPFDAERIEWTLALAEAGRLGQLVWSHDVYLKHMLREHGGFGYAHISEFIVPRVLGEGLTDADIRTIMVENPRRLLTLAPPTREPAERPRPASRR